MRLGTRASTLAMTQSTWVADRLRALGHEVEVVPIRTRGDRERGSLKAVEGLGVFAAELRSALLEGEVDLAVHSLKDLPVEPVPGLVIAAVPTRESALDALCARDGLTLAELPPGALVGTGSPRRVAQLRGLRPDLTYVDIRGNIDTRLARVTQGDLDAVVLAAAGLRRLGLAGRITEDLPILPAPGQGALAVECRVDDKPLREVLSVIDDPTARLCVMEERAVLAALGGGCAAPIAARGEGGSLVAGVFSHDGTQVVTAEESLAPGAGERVAARLLDAGAGEVTELGASRESRLAEFHDAADLWPAEARRTVFLPREAGAISTALEAQGLAVTAWPVQVRVVLEVDHLPDADWSIVTSARTVETLEELGLRLPGRIAAVGRATARALEQAGYEVDFVPRQASGDGIVTEFEATPARVLIPGSALSKPNLPDGLRDLGHEVSVVPVYTMEPTGHLPEDLVASWRAGEFGAVVVTSGSMARAIHERLGWPPATRVLAIGQPTLRVLNELGVAASAATSPDAEEVARATAELIRKGNA
ncbi:hydroxymethylbilane synthase [Arachnia propionica]|uniref:Porphobilinogen deaminase n=1 Tax=Arachnia propionica TaxID=1750 RepID=A0A3P1X165_9ACTN|nr:hydroxymethylbilane synthase [Arachnia propionica]